MCRLLGVSKQAYYKHEDRLIQHLAQESFVVEFIKDVRKKDPGIGGNKLWLMYRDYFGAENSVGYNRFYDIIEQYGLKVRKRRRRVSTTDSRHNLPLYPNLVKDLIPSLPRQLFVSDITYIPLWSPSHERRIQILFPFHRDRLLYKGDCRIQCGRNLGNRTHAEGFGHGPQAL